MDRVTGGDRSFVRAKPITSGDHSKRGKDRFERPQKRRGSRGGGQPKSSFKAERIRLGARGRASQPAGQGAKAQEVGDVMDPEDDARRVDVYV